MAVQIGAKPDSGFDDPIGMLTDCHRRIERFLQVLALVAERAQGRALSEEEAAAVKAALEYFRVGGERHTIDEEESLFPRMREADAAGELAALETDHETAAKLHAEVEQLYAAWMGAGALEAEEARRLLEATGQLRELYAAHIRVEEDVVFPRARVVLDGGAVRAMGEEFRARRV